METEATESNKILLEKDQKFQYCLVTEEQEDRTEAYLYVLIY